MIYSTPTTFTLIACIILFFVSSLNSVSKAAGDNNNKQNTLIIVDKPNEFKQSHSVLIKTIEDLSQTVHLKAADSSSFKLEKYGEYLYHNVLVLCTRGSGVKDILEFIDAGRNVFIAGTSSQTGFLSDLIKQVGFEFTSKRERNFKNTKLNHAFHIVGSESDYPNFDFSYTGTELKMVKSDLTIEILTNNAPVDDIRANPSSDYLTSVLIGCMQARNNARVVVSGSLEFFSDKALSGANKVLTTELLRWLLKQKALLRHSEVNYRKLNGEKSDIAIMDDVEYSIKIEHYDNGKWIPYTSDDVQLEFVRIDPFVRQTMQRKSDGTYLAQFKVPDVYGVFKFQVDYKKEGLTYLFSSTQVPVRPLRHNEYERYIYSAYPYYLSAFLMIIYLYIFTFVYLYQQKKNK